MHLLDVNVLIALLDANHLQHAPAKAFFRGVINAGWATCPITENGVLRILGSPRYPNGPGSPEEARKLLGFLVSVPGHQRWADEPSLLDLNGFPRLPASKHLTDVYLLALAVSRQARFATFDTGVDPALVSGGPSACHVISRV